MKTFYDAFFQFPVRERQRIAKNAGMSLPYLLKHIYVNKKKPRFHLHNAVSLDRASGGVLRFWEHTEGDVDWQYVLDRLREAKRKGGFSATSGNTKRVDINTLA